MNKRELNTVLAALRCWQQHPMRGDCGLDEIATDGGVKALDGDEIDDLCEQLNCAPHCITVTVEDGAIQGIEDIPPGVIVRVMDFDTDGVDADTLSVTDAGEFYIESIYEGGK